MEVLQDTYKDTKVGRIPKDWEVNLFGNFVEIKSGFGFKKDDYSENGFRLLRIDNVTYGKIIWNNIAHIPFSFEEKHKDLVLSSGDILLALNRPITNNQLKIGRITKNDLPSILYQRVGKLSSSSQELRDDFLYYLSKYFIYFFVQKSSVGSDQPFINLTSLRKMKVPIPSLTEQQKIAAILSTVDEQISTTDKIIEKSKELKKGLMQKLFSEGIGHTEFKDTKIGRIPKDWEVKNLSDHFNVIDGDRGKNYPSSTDFYDEEYCLFLSAKNVTKNGFRFSQVQFITKEKDKLLRKGKIERNDLILTTRGTVGNFAFYDSSVPFQNIRINSGMVMIRLKEGVYNKFLYQYFKSRYLDNQITQIVSGSAQPQLTVRAINKIKLIVPPLQEQQKIAAILSEADAKIEKEQTQKAQLEQLKKGLMQQLLTGKKRVKV